MLDFGKDYDWFVLDLIVSLIVVLFVGFVIFVIWEFMDDNLIVNFKIFCYWGFVISLIVLVLVMGVYFVMIVFMFLWF